MRSTPARALAALLLLATAAAPTLAAPPFRRLDPAATKLLATTAAVEPADDVTLLAVDDAAVRAFRDERGGRLSLPDASAAGSVELDLEPYELFAPGAGVTTTDDRGRHPYAADVTLFRGRVAGETDSWAVVAMGGSAIFGVVERAGRRWTISPAQRLASGRAAHALGVHAYAPEGSFSEQISHFECGINAGNEVAYGLKTVPLEAGRGRTATPEATQINAPRFTFNLAVDCDYEIYGVKFGGDLAAATAYVLTVLGTTNLIDERDLEATLKLVYLNLWTTSADPYTQPTTSGELSEFKSYWLAANGGISSHLQHLISGRGLGGGIAFLDAVCSGNGYGVSAIDAIYSYPTTTTTWDIEVVTHEMGHGLGSPHTHSCTWAQEGRVPAHTTLDSCQASEGSCASYSNHLPPDKGTIMSYCHLIGGVANGLRLDFHPVCVSRMRGVMSNCGLFPTPAPPRNPVATPISTGVRLTWTASTSSGVLRYSVVRSRLPLDLNAGYVGFTGTSPFDGPGLGDYYFRVRAVRAADSSAFSAEVKGSACPFSSAAPVLVGSLPTAATSEDLNEDGIQDVVLVTGGSGNLVTLLGQGTGGVGNGSFAAPVSVSTGLLPACLALLDVNGDGILDAVVGAQDDNTLRLHLGQGSGGVGNGTFEPGAILASLTFAPSGIAVGDFNADGILDLAVAGGSTSLALLLGQGTAGVTNGTFADPATVSVGSATRGVLAYDFNADGILDLATTGGGLRVLLGNGTGGKGDGTFAVGPTVPLGSTPNHLATADLNGDGIADLVVCNTGGNSLSVLLGNGTGGVGDGTFAAATSVPAGTGPNAVAVGDWDQNGIPDLAIASNNSGNATSVLLGLGGGAFEAAQTFATGGTNPGFIAVNDFNEDGTPDLFACNRGTQNATRQLAGCPAVLSHALAIVSPNGGEVWTGDDPHVVTWTKGAGVLTVDLQRSDDGGANWRTLARGLTGTSAAYTVVPPWTTHARFRVVESHAAEYADASNADFEVKEPIQLGVDDGPPRLALLGAWPNPARAELTVSLSLAVGDRPGALELLDLAGRRVAVQDLSSLGAGRHQVRLLERGAAHPGVYMVRLTHAGETRRMKVAVIR